MIPGVELLITLDIISLLLAIYMAVIFYRAKRNPMMFYFSVSVVYLNALALLGFFYGFDWSKAPLPVCYMQALMVQFGALMTGICAFNFIIQVYRLLVLRKQSEMADSQLISYYYGIMIIYPIIGTMVISYVSIYEKAAGARDFKCDIVSPIWVRLFGYNGINLFISIPGTYFSTRATLVVARHLDQFKTTHSSIQSRTPMMESGNMSNVTIEEDMIPQEPQERTAAAVVAPTGLASNKSYNVTKAAAIRMVFFTTAYMTTNLLASVDTILTSLNHKSLTPKPNSADLVFATLGIALFLIFGTAADVRKWTFRKLKNLFRSNRRRSTGAF